jgi:hypothetical protein
LKKVGAIYGFIKKVGLSYDFAIFWDFLELVLYRKSHGLSLWIMKPWLALSPWLTHDHGVVRPLRGSGGCCDSSERERERERESRSKGFSPMMLFGGGAAEMATQRRSIEVTGGALMGTWFQARGGEIGVRVGVVDNGGALVAHFIGS